MKIQIFVPVSLVEEFEGDIIEGDKCPLCRSGKIVGFYPASYQRAKFLRCSNEHCRGHTPTLRKIEIELPLTATSPPPKEDKLSAEELAKMRSEIKRQEEWAVNSGYARRCPNCNDVVWANSRRRCRCGKITAAIVITEEDMRRYGLA